MKKDTMTSADAYAAMYDFLSYFYEEAGLDSIGALLGSMSLLPDGNPADPAIPEQWRNSVDKAKSNNVDLNLKIS